MDSLERTNNRKNLFNEKPNAVSNQNVSLEWFIIKAPSVGGELSGQLVCLQKPLGLRTDEVMRSRSGLCLPVFYGAMMCINQD